MIVYVDIEHRRVETGNPGHWQEHLSRVLAAKFRFEALSGRPCLIVHYQTLSPAMLKRVQARAVLVSGHITEATHYAETDLAGLRAVLRQAAQPIIGFCGGAQFIATTFGGQVGPIAPEETGTMDNGLWRRRTHEHGFTAVHRLAEHPLLAGLGAEFLVWEEHYWEIKRLPDGFVNLAATGVTANQCIAHQTLPVFGVQFHPERWDDRHPAGRILLENFFKLIE